MIDKEKLHCRVLLVDDHPLMRKGLSQLLEEEPRFEVVGSVGNGLDAIAEANELLPDLIVLDLNMKGMSGVDTLRALRSEGSKAAIVVLTVSDNAFDIEAALEVGADGYLLKDTEPDRLIQQMHEVLDGKKVYSEIVQKQLEKMAGEKSIFDQLTQREVQILRHVAQGHRNKQIAEILYISEATVKVHMKSLLKKLNVPSRTAATILYLEQSGEVS
ncbi:response regulator [Vibrio sp. S4M6]|uniref:response regulator n=1 Tax=Vibrio sinus TaxID=2946865 RepID=UPI00202A79DD|nr:response regulator [Vibrio sinus]MCL9783213.1 response regulator [Vibrio sinus]